MKDFTPLPILPPPPNLAQLSLATFTLDCPRCVCLWLCSPFYLQYNFSSTTPRSNHVLSFLFSPGVQLMLLVERPTDQLAWLDAGEHSCSGFTMALSTPCPWFSQQSSPPPTSHSPFGCLPWCFLNLGLGVDIGVPFRVEHSIDTRSQYFA